MRFTRLLPFFAVAGLLQPLPVPASAQETWDLPGVIVCTLSDKDNLAYLASVDEDGTATYMGLAGGAAEVSPGSTIVPSSTMNVGDCEGRTLQELRDAGKTLEFSQ